MGQIWHRPERRQKDVPVSWRHPLPVFTPAAFAAPQLLGAPFAVDYMWRLALEGRLYVAGDADANDMVTGQTSFAATTPTFLLRVPSGSYALPLFVNLMQSGTVAGGDIELVFEVDKRERYSTGGTSEKVFSTLNKRAPRCTLWSGATAVDTYGMRVFGADLAADVSPAEGAPNGIFWKSEIPYLLCGPAAFLIFSSAGTTGPSWLWSIGWAEWTADEIEDNA